MSDGKLTTQQQYVIIREWMNNYFFRFRKRSKEEMGIKLGTYTYTDKLVTIREDLTYNDKLTIYVLLHELGHRFADLCYPGYREQPLHLKEYLATEEGWELGINLHIGLTADYFTALYHADDYHKCREAGLLPCVVH